MRFQWKFEFTAGLFTNSLALITDSTPALLDAVVTAILIIAALLAPKQVVKSLKNEADQIEEIRNSSDFKAVEQFYQHFDAVSDDQIMQTAKRRFVSKPLSRLSSAKSHHSF